MYNRYVPQPDGSYRKNRMPDTVPSPPPPQASPPPQQQENACPPPPPPQPPRQEYRQGPPCGQNILAGDFLRRLLPKNLDTGDLLVIVLLLLMAGDSAEDKNSALLTLALYLFM